MKLTDRYTKILLIGIIAVAVLLRLYNLSFTPPSLDWDEASLGYNAYSVLHTGRDEYGKFLPVVIRSLNDYKPALYMYVLVPSVKIFGLTDFAVRFPSAVIGVLTVITSYFLVLELFKKKSIALLTTLLLAFSPWDIQFSRFACEALLGLELNLLMILFFLKGLKKPWFLCLSALFAGLALYSYQNEKLFVPLLALVLLVIYRKEVFRFSKKYLLSVVVVGALVSLPLVLYTISNPTASLMRAKGASIVNNPVGVLNATNFYPAREMKDRQNHDQIGLILDNRRIAYVKDIANNYLSHFDINYLFITGEKIRRHEAPGMAHLYLIELPFLLLGLFWLFSKKEFDRKTKLVIVSWILLVPLPAAFTWDVPNAIRTLNFIPTFQILIAIGLLGAYEYVKTKKKIVRYLSLSIFAFIALFNLVYYLDAYFVQYNYFNSKDWQYGYPKIVEDVEKVYDNYNKIVVSNKAPLDQSYIFFLYQLQYPPSDYQEISANQYKHFEKFQFRNIDKNEKEKGTLYVISPQDFTWDYKNNIIDKVDYLNGDPGVVLVGVNK